MSSVRSKGKPALEQAGELSKAIVGERQGREFGYVTSGSGGWAAPWHDAVFETTVATMRGWVREEEASRVKTGVAPVVEEEGVVAGELAARRQLGAALLELGDATLERRREGELLPGRG